MPASKIFIASLLLLLASVTPAFSQQSRGQQSSDTHSEVDVFAEGDAVARRAADDEMIDSSLEVIEVEPMGAIKPVQYVDTVEHIDTIDEQHLADDPFSDDAVLDHQDSGDMQSNDYPIYSSESYFPEAQHQSCPPNCRCKRRASPYWLKADYLHWWLDGAGSPALVATSTPGTDRSNAAVLGLPSTTVLLGGNELGDESRSGARIEFGSWMPNRGFGWHVAYFGVDDTQQLNRFSSDQFAILGRPFFSVEPGDTGQNAELIGLPGQLTGNITVDSSTQFSGGELMVHWTLADRANRRIRFIAGYQRNELDDDLTITDFKQVIGGQTGLAIGTTLAERDQFSTQNEFNGVAIGVLASGRYCRYSMDLGMRLGIGNNHSSVTIDGSTTSTVPIAGSTNTATTRGGLLALGSNIGNYEQDMLSVVPQLNVEVGYDLRRNLRGVVGYRFIYWSQVARASEQIDSGLNLSQLDPAGSSGELRPQFNFQLTDFWAQGLTAGLDYRF